VSDELPERIFFNPLSITESNLDRIGAYQIYARTHSYSGDVEYRLVGKVSEQGDNSE